jgi:ubiquinone/menaquinone biosynthesis C-methylase UbiE
MVHSDGCEFPEQARAVCAALRGRKQLEWTEVFMPADDQVAPGAASFTRPEAGEFYDELPLWSAPFGLLLLDRVPMRPGMSILDVGAGTGFLTLELAQRCGPGSTVFAVDPWAAAMRRLRRKLAFFGVQNVRLLEQDAAALDLPDASIDLVVSNLGINNFDNPDAVLRACVRVMKTGGRLLLTTNLVGHMHEFYDVYGAVLQELGLIDRVPALEAHVAHRATLESLQTMLTRAGLEPLETVTDTMRMRYADGSSFLRHYFIRLGFLEAWQEVVPAEVVEPTFALLEQKLNALAAERGELALTIPMACVDAQKPGAGAGRPRSSSSRRSRPSRGA